MTKLSGRPGSNRPPEAWKATALPNELLPLIIFQILKFQIRKFKELWAEQGSNLRTRERTDLQSVAFNHSAICPIFGASGGIRTPDQLITNQLLWPTELHWQLPKYRLIMNFPQKYPAKGYFLGRQR